MVRCRRNTDPPCDRFLPGSSSTGRQRNSDGGLRWDLPLVVDASDVYKLIRDLAMFGRRDIERPSSRSSLSTAACSSSACRSLPSM